VDRPALFNVAALAGTIALDLGYSDGDLEYREWPWWIRLIFLAALVVTAWNLIATVARRSSEDIYLSNWYIIGATLWAAIISVVGVVPWYQYGLGQVAVSGFYMHNAVGMWFTPVALGVIYYDRGGCRPPPSCSAWRCWSRYGAVAATFY
jgi:cytochrome c oxidase cbb3-type subunit I